MSEKNVIVKYLKVNPRFSSRAASDAGHRSRRKRVAYARGIAYKPRGVASGIPSTPGLLFRGSRRQLGLSLREAFRRCAEFGQPIPYSSLSKIELGQLAPGLHRLHCLAKVYGLSFATIEEALDLEQLGGVLPEGKSFRELYKDGLDLWKRGETRAGLAHLLKLRQRTAGTPKEKLEQQRGLLFFAIACGSLGKYNLGLTIAQELILRPPSPDLLPSVLIEAAVCWNGLGSAEMAIALLDRARVHVKQDDFKSRAWMHHERSLALIRLGELDEAGKALESALESYREADDDYGYSRALGARVTLARRRGKSGAALEAARTAKGHAERHGFERLVLFRKLAEGTLLAETGKLEQGLAQLERSLSDAIATGDGACRFYAHYYLWKCHRQLPHSGREKLEFENARYYLRFVDESSEETEDLRSIIAEREERV